MADDPVLRQSSPGLTPEEEEAIDRRLVALLLRSDVHL